jgi:hypothetical protein
MTGRQKGLRRLRVCRAAEKAQMFPALTMYKRRVAPSPAYLILNCMGMVKLSVAPAS